MSLNTTRYSLIAILLLFAGCAKMPVFTPPSDPFNRSLAEYQSAHSFLERLLANESSDNQSQEVTVADVEHHWVTLNELVKAEHVPSAHYLGELHLLIWAKQSQAVRQQSQPRQALDQESINSHLNKALELFEAAARYGYPESQVTLEKLGASLPPVDQKPPALREAEQEYTAAMQDYEQQKDRLAKIFLGALASGAAGLASYHGARNASVANNSLQSFNYPKGYLRQAPSSGNQYTTRHLPNGSTITSGWNTKTGSRWTNTTHPNGNQNGIDSKGNHWTFNSSSKFYINHGTGETCYGEGIYRTCF